MEGINSKKLLITEGKEDKTFLEILLKHLNLNNDIQIIPLEGKDKLKARFEEILNTSGFENVQVLAIVLDGDFGLFDRKPKTEDAFKMVQNILKKHELYPSETSWQNYQTEWITHKEIKVGIFIIETMLEDLCLEIATNKQLTQCITQFNNCINPKKVHPKALANLFFSIEGNYKDRLNEKTINNPQLFDLESKSSQFIKLRSFLQEFTA